MTALKDERRRSPMPYMVGVSTLAPNPCDPCEAKEHWLIENTFYTIMALDIFTPTRTIVQ